MTTFTFSQLNTPLGRVTVIANETHLYFLEFEDSRGFLRRLERFKKKVRAEHLIEGATPAIQSIEHELKQYFSGKLQEFKTPIFLCGTDFQQQVWKTLQKIPFGKTLSYTGVAETIGNPNACRAVANANARNTMAIIIPCHRVIQTNGLLGGYGGGIDRKKQLLDLEGAQYFVD